VIGINFLLGNFPLTSTQLIHYNNVHSDGWTDKHEVCFLTAEISSHINQVLLTFRPCSLYIGQSYRFSPQNTSYIFSQQYTELFVLDLLAPSPFIPVQNVMYFTMLPFFRSIKYHILHK